MATKRKLTERSPEEQAAFLRDLETYQEGYQRAKEEANSEIVCRTPQDILWRTEEGRRQLDAPENLPAQRAALLAHRFFRLACSLADEATPLDLRAQMTQEVHKAWLGGQNDIPQNRLRDFLTILTTERRNYRWAREAWNTDPSPGQLPQDPRGAELERERRKRERKERLPGHHAEAVEVYFLNLYPDERGRLNLSKLAQAIEALEADGATGPGIKEDKSPSKYQPLAEAIANTSFAKPASQLRTAVLRAEKALTRGPSNRTSPVRLFARSLCVCGRHTPRARAGKAMPSRITAHEARALAARAFVDPRSLRKYLAGEPLAQLTRARIVLALREARPELLAPDDLSARSAEPQPPQAA